MMELVLDWTDKPFLHDTERQPDMRMTQICSDRIKDKTQKVNAKNIPGG